MHLLCLGYEASFLDLMHDVVHAALIEGADEGIQAEATQRGFGWLHIQGVSPSHLFPHCHQLNFCCTDERNVPALGRIGDPDDILGSVRVEDGEVSY